MNPVLIISGLALLIVEGAKKTGLPSRYLPLSSIGIGLAAGVVGLLVYKNLDLLWIGVWSGAAASGVYDNLSAFTEIYKARNEN